MKTPQQDNQEPKDSDSPRSPQKITKRWNMLARFGVPALVVLLGAVLLGVVAIRLISSNMSHINIQEKPISAVLNLADHRLLQSVTISGDDIFATGNNSQQYHAVKEDNQSVTEIFRHDGVTVNIDNGQQGQWTQGLLDILFLGIVVGVLYFFFRRGGVVGRATAFCPSKGKRLNYSRPPALFQICPSSETARTNL